MSNHLQQTSSTRSLAVSDAGIAKALRYLGSDQRPNGATALLPPHVCDAVIARHSDIGPVISEPEAREATLALLAGYPGAFTADAGERLPYMAKIKGVFCNYPAWAVAKVVAPGFRFSGNPSFRPNDKEVAEALDGIIREYRAYAVRAKWHKEEGERRATEATYRPISSQRVTELLGVLKNTKVIEPESPAPKDHSAKASNAAVRADIAARRAAMTPEQLAEHDATISALSQKPEEKAA